jgi:hypothetical protein
MRLISISESPKTDKKLMAVFENSETGRKKTIHFGAKGMDDYTITKDKAQRERYLTRHVKNENWANPVSAGALSRFILWGASTSRATNIAEYRRRFNL